MPEIPRTFKLRDVLATFRELFEKKSEIILREIYKLQLLKCFEIIMVDSFVFVFRETAVKNIQKYLRQKKYEEAVGLLRTSR